MTPKEKALELFNNYYLVIRFKANKNDYLTNIYQSKECVLITINEIIKTKTSGNEFFYYWDEVKKEIEKLWIQRQKHSI